MPTHYDTPKRSKIKGTVEYLKAKGLPCDTEDVIAFFGGKSTQGYEILKQPDRTRHNNGLNETRGRSNKMTGAQVAEGDKVIEEPELEFEGKALSWGGIAETVGADVHWETAKRTFEKGLDLHKRLAAFKQHLPNDVCRNRVEHAHYHLHLRPEPDDWKDVRFSDEVHEAYGPEGRKRIIRAPGTRYRPDNIQRADVPAESDRPRKHAWACIGWNFKTSLYFYKIPSNTNGKMTNKMYVQILNDCVLPWLEAGEDFTLEEDRDGAHETKGENGIVVKWKQRHKLKHFFNAERSPDLAPIENCFHPLKQYMKQHAITDEERLEEIMNEGWNDHVSQDFINEQVLSMPRRLKDCILAGGAMTGW